MVLRQRLVGEPQVGRAQPAAAEGEWFERHRVGQRHLEAVVVEEAVQFAGAGVGQLPPGPAHEIAVGGALGVVEGIALGVDELEQVHGSTLARTSGRPGASHYRGAVRIGMISPYSLTLPGGVQGQILGLARAMRAMGHEVRVLGPCDGPPPDAGVTPLGNSVPTAANGSVAPIAPDPSAQLRTIRALRDEDFDVVHLHEPLAPGPTQTAMFFKTGPLLGTFHAAGGSAAYKWFSPGVKWLARRLDLRCAVSDDAEQMARAALGGTYDVLFNGVEVTSFAKATPAPTDGPTIFFIGRHEPRKGLDVLLAAMTDLPPNVRLWIAGDGPDTERAPGPRGRRRPHRVARAHQRRGAGRPDAGGGRVLRAVAARGVVRGRAARGHGRRHPGGGQRPARLLERGPGRSRRPARPARRRRPPWPPRSAVVLTDAERAPGLVASGEERATEFSMEHLAEEYLGRYRQHRPPGDFAGPTYPYDEPDDLLLVIGGLILLLLMFLVATYNGLVRMRNRIDAAWAQIDVQLKRRFDLIPNLVETVKGYAAHEQSTFEKVTQARNMAMAATGPAEAAQADNVLSGALKSLFAVSEAYPDLKANQNFLNLQEELTGTEDKISYARQFYNDTVYKYNTKIQSVPANMIAGPFHFTEREYFEADDGSRGPVKVSF